MTYTAEQLRERAKWIRTHNYDLSVAEYLELARAHADTLEENARLTRECEFHAKQCARVDELRHRAEAELAETRRDLQFIERWANHHGQKPNITPREVLSMIQHYPPILEITRSYEDGKVPDTPNPWAELAKLRQMVAQQAEDEGLWFNAATAPEAYLQQELRKLHAAIEETK